MLSDFLWVYLILIGVVAGFSAGLLGIGGGMIIVPVLTFVFTKLNFDHDLIIKFAIATSMATIIFTSLSSVRAHQKKGAIEWSVVYKTTPGIILGGLIASIGIFSIIKGAILSLFFALFVGYSGYKMFAGSKTAERPYRPTSTLMFGMVGILVGFFSGLVGAGGGFLMVPFMNWRGISIHRTVATSAATGFPIALFNSIGYVISGQSSTDSPEFLGYIYLPALAIISLASVCFAPLGARMAHKLPVAKLKRTMGVILLLLAGYMLLRLL